MRISSEETVRHVEGKSHADLGLHLGGIMKGNQIWNGINIGR